MQIRTVIAQGQSAHDHPMEVAYRELLALSADSAEGVCRLVPHPEAV